MYDTSSEIPWSRYITRYAQLPDARLRTRLETILDGLVTHPTASLAEAMGTDQAVDAYYAFVNNPRVTASQLVELGQRAVCATVHPGQLVIVIHDTSEYNYQTHYKTTGLGPLSNPLAQGLHVHSALALTSEGLPLGLLHQECWARDASTTGTKLPPRQRAFAEKESARWQRGIRAVDTCVPPHGRVLHIADREADIYPLWAADGAAHRDLLFRVQWDRRITGVLPDLRHLREAAEAAPEFGGQYVAVQRHGEKPERIAHVCLQVTRVQLHRPRHVKAETAPARTPWLTLIRAVEVEPPPGEAPIEWLLLTTLTVADLAMAWQVVYWYSLRWVIERYHGILKSGFHQEARQLRTAEGLEKALALNALAAVRLLWVTYAARLAPEAPCTIALTTREWQTAHIATQTTPLPSIPPSLAHAIWQIGLLGGHRPWPSAGPPGMIVLWRGWRTLQTMVEYATRLEARPNLQQRSGT